MIAYRTLSAILPLALWLAGCGEGQPPSPSAAPAVSATGFVPEQPQRSGDPQAGYRALVNEGYVSCGIPYSAWQRLAPPTEERDLLPGREGRNAELPYYQNFHVTDDGVDLVVANCLGCHAGRFNGELIIGLGDETVDFTGDAVVAAESVGAYLNDPAEIQEWQRWADRVAAIEPYRRTDTVGVNPAVSLTAALFAHRNPTTLAWSNQPFLEPPPPRPLPVSVPPWWRMSKKHAAFYTAAGQGDHARYMILISTYCTDTVAEAEAIDRYAPDIRAYIASLEAPEWPFELDTQLAAEGQLVFQAHCSRCHGTYGEQESYPNLVIPLAEIGTDATLAEYMTGEYAGIYGQWFEDSFYGELSDSLPAPGYYAPPLDGVWATAPYLHNGSVPSIEVLLDSPRRPRYWKRTSLDSTDYDTRTLGWHYKVLDYGKEGAADARERKMIYDTTLPGYANGGHTFGDGLTAQQRRAVLEYLKTL
ncbi:MAG: c-type cytochrome, partial [Candidatus Competibacteraceae bacterium]|nr:c-type cytochrome [Candidatus Competibacteraceae bacterium]